MMALGFRGPPAAPTPPSEPPPLRRGDTVGAARAGLDVLRVTFVLWMIAHRRIGQGDLAASREEVRR